MLTFLLLRCLFEIADLVVRPESLELMSLVHKVQCCNELLCELVVLSASARTSTEKKPSGVSLYLVHCILQLRQSISHCGVAAIECRGRL